MSSVWYRINSPSIIHERFDNELVAINMEKGTYHSMTDSASDAFELLSAGATADELAEALAMKYSATPQDIKNALGTFIKDLLAEELIVPARASDTRSSVTVPPAENRLPFHPPSLQAFRDLEGLLLLDPIHEAGEEGWPPPPASLST